MILSFDPEDDPIDFTNGITLTWTTSYAKSATLTAAGAGVTIPQPSLTGNTDDPADAAQGPFMIIITPSPTETTTYTLTVIGEDGTAREDMLTVEMEVMTAS